MAWTRTFSSLARAPTRSAAWFDVYEGRLNLDQPAGTNAIGTASVLVGHNANNNFGIVVWQASNQINGNSNFTLTSLGTIPGGVPTNDGQLWLNGFSDTIGGLQDTGGLGTAIVQCQSPSTTSSLTVSPSAGTSFNYGGILRDGSTTTEGQLSFHMGGLGQQILSGQNLYTGATTVNSGTLTINSSLPTANITISGDLNGNGTINFGNGSQNGEIVVNSSGTLELRHAGRLRRDAVQHRRTDGFVGYARQPGAGRHVRPALFRPGEPAFTGLPSQIHAYRRQ